MKRSTIFYAVSIVLFVSLFGAQMVFADSEHGEGNDPTLDPHANACMAGGTLEGQCDSDLLWNAGWYLIRYEHELIDLHEFPTEYAWVLGTADDIHENEPNPAEEVCFDPAPEEPDAH